jgi:hypothetical protein
MARGRLAEVLWSIAAFVLIAGVTVVIIVAIMR